MTPDDQTADLLEQLGELDEELSILAVEMNRLADEGHQTAESEVRLHQLRERVKIILRLLKSGQAGHH